MTQPTRVFTGIDASAAERLRQALSAALPAGAEWRQPPHARFSVKAAGVVLTCYESGKLVAQGRDLDAYFERFLPGLAAAAAPEPTPETTLAATTIGSDEAGKGDYFGPLVVAAACVRPDQAAALRQAGVVDSKRLADNRARLLAGHLERELAVEVAELMPATYNAAIARAGNLNLLLADLHTAALSRLWRRCPQAQSIVVDRFAAEALLDGALDREAPGHPPLVQVPGGERNLAVAAASIVARARFLDGLLACSHACGTDLPKGAGAPVDAVAKDLFRAGGRELLAQVAKLHFATTGKVTGS